MRKRDNRKDFKKRLQEKRYRERGGEEGRGGALGLDELGSGYFWIGLEWNLVFYSLYLIPPNLTVNITLLPFLRL